MTVKEELKILITTLNHYHVLSNGEQKAIKSIEAVLNDYDLLKGYLNRNWVEVINDEKKLKALEIIKEKRVDIHNFIYSSNVEEYNKFAMNYNQELCNTLLTLEEFNLLKGVLL